MRWLAGWIACCVVLLVSLTPSAGTAQTDVAAIVSEDADELNSSSNMQVHVTFVPGESEAIDASTIGVNTQQLQDLSAKISALQFRDLVSLLLAHEFGHIMQFKRYGVTTVLQATAEQRRVYEAQADFLAGQYMGIVLGASPGSQQSLEAIEDALDAMYSQGVVVFASDTKHPTEDQRLTAVRLGMATGTMISLAKAAKAHNDPQLEGAASVLAQKLDFSGTTDMLDYSLRIAEKIMHFSNLRLSMVDLTQHDVKWSTSAASPLVAYKLTYLNSGTEEVSVDMDVQCWSVPRADDSDWKHASLWSSAHYTFVLAPGHSRQITGQLPWYATTTLMPRIVYPFNKAALITAF